MARLKLAFCSLLFVVPCTASAVQVLEGVDGQSMLARVPLNDVTMIRVEGGRIKSVDGLEGTFIAEKNEDIGLVTMKPMVNRPFSLFVTDDQGRTFTILMTPADIPAELLVIKDKSRKAAPSKIEKSGSYERMLKGMILIMASDSVPNDMEVRELGQEIPLWHEAKFVLDRSYIAQNIVGEKYFLANVSKEAMVVAEQELFRRGTLAISVENMNLAPGESTNVFLVREKKPTE